LGWNLLRASTPGGYRPSIGVNAAVNAYAYAYTYTYAYAYTYTYTYCYTDTYTYTYTCTCTYTYTYTYSYSYDDADPYSNYYSIWYLDFPWRWLLPQAPA
jgi:hypothetical protein